MGEIIGIKLNEMKISPNELQVQGKYTLQDILDKKISIDSFRLQTDKDTQKSYLIIDFVKERNIFPNEKGVLRISIIRTDENEKYIKKYNEDFEDYTSSKFDTLINHFFLKLVNSNVNQEYDELLDKAA